MVSSQHSMIITVSSLKVVVQFTFCNEWTSLTSTFLYNYRENWVQLPVADCYWPIVKQGIDSRLQTIILVPTSNARRVSPSCLRIVPINTLLSPFLLTMLDDNYLINRAFVSNSWGVPRTASTKKRLSSDCMASCFICCYTCWCYAQPSNVEKGQNRSSWGCFLLFSQNSYRLIWLH